MSDPVDTHWPILTALEQRLTSLTEKPHRVEVEGASRSSQTADADLTDRVVRVLNRKGGPKILPHAIAD